MFRGKIFAACSVIECQHVCTCVGRLVCTGHILQRAAVLLLIMPIHGMQSTSHSFSSLSLCLAQGNLRVTVQGEIIEQQFADREVCFRTFDLYTSAVLEASLDPPAAPKVSFRFLNSVCPRGLGYRTVIRRSLPMMQIAIGKCSGTFERVWNIAIAHKLPCKSFCMVAPILDHHIRSTKGSSLNSGSSSIVIFLGCEPSKLVKSALC